MSEKWTQQREETVERFQEWMEERGMTQTEAARVVDIHSSTLGQMLNKKYSGRVGRICDRMNRILKHARLREEIPGDPPFARTSVAERVTHALGLAHVESRMTMILGPTGIGKTTAVKRYCEKWPGTVYVMAAPHSSPCAVLRTLAEKLGVQWSGSSYDMRKAVARVLGQTDRLLVVDDIDYTPEETVQDLRVINEVGDVGIALVGTEAYYEKLSERPSATIRQFLHRVAYVEKLGPCSEDDIERIASPYNLSEEALEMLTREASGEARRAAFALVRAQTIGGDGVEAGDLRSAINRLAPKLPRG